MCGMADCGFAQVVGLRLSGLASGGDCWGDVTRLELRLEPGHSALFFLASSIEDVRLVSLRAKVICGVATTNLVCIQHRHVTFCRIRHGGQEAS